MNKNPHIGRSLEDFFVEMDQWDAVKARSDKMSYVHRLQIEMKKRKISKAELARRVGTSRSHIDNVLDIDNIGITITTLHRVAAALGLQYKGYFLPIQKMRKTA